MVRSATDKGYTEATTFFSGTLTAEISMDSAAKRAEWLRFTGGELVYSDTVSTYTPDPPPKTEDLRITNTGVRGPLRPLTPFPSVDPLTGKLNNAEHGQVLSAGTLRTEYSVPFFGSWVSLADETRDFSISPEQTPFTGTTTVSADYLEPVPFAGVFSEVLPNFFAEPGFREAGGDCFRPQ